MKCNCTKQQILVTFFTYLGSFELLVIGFTPLYWSIGIGLPFFIIGSVVTLVYSILMALKCEEER